MCYVSTFHSFPEISSVVNIKPKKKVSLYVSNNIKSNQISTLEFFKRREHIFSGIHMTPELWDIYGEMFLEGKEQIHTYWNLIGQYSCLVYGKHCFQPMNEKSPHPSKLCNRCGERVYSRGTPKKRK